MNIKNVYMTHSRGEMSIEIVRSKTADSLRAAVLKVMEQNATMIMDSYIEEADEDDVNEMMSSDFQFYNSGFVGNKFAGVSSGEEGATYIFAEGNEWFDKVENHKDWSEEEYNKFCDYIDENCNNGGEGVEMSDNEAFGI